MTPAVPLLLFAAVLISIVLAAVAALAEDRSSRSVRFMYAANVGTAIWAAGYLVQLGWSSYADPAVAPMGSVDWLLVVFITLGIGVSATYWFLFCASLSRRAAWWTEGLGFRVAHVPALYLMAVAWTNPLHHLFVARTATGSAGGVLAVPHYASMTALLVGGIVYATPLPREGILSHHVRRQRIVVALAACLPLLTTLMWTGRRFGLEALTFNPTPAAFAVVGLVIGYQVLYRGLGEIVPLATLSSLVQHTDTRLAYLDPDFRFVSVNEAFLLRSRRRQDELLGRSYFDVMPDDGRRTLFETALAERRPVERRDDIDVFPSGPDEPESCTNWWLVPVPDSRGDVQGFVLSLIDVTDSAHERELAHTLAELEMGLHREFASDAVLWDVAVAAADALHSELTLLTSARERGWRSRSTRDAVRGEPYESMMLPHIDLAITTARIVAMTDAETDDRFEPSLLRAQGIRSALVVPLVSSQGVIGALSFERPNLTRPFDAVESDFAERFAYAVMLAMENARLYQDERRIAQTLQESMLRVSFHVPSVDFSHTYRSATEAARVGGDFYDLFETDDGRVGMLIGDVSGHGIEAAVLTSLIKDTVCSEAIEQISPAAILGKVNEVLRRRSDPEIFASALLGFLDPVSGALTYCSAGHPPPIRLRPDGTADELTQHGPVLGIAAGVAFSDTSESLAPGEMLVLYTDGLTEARRGTERYRTWRVREALKALAGRTARELTSGLFESVRAFTGDSFSDDVALVALRILPSSDSEADAPARAAG